MLKAASDNALISTLLEGRDGDRSLLSMTARDRMQKQPLPNGRAPFRGRQWSSVQQGSGGKRLLMLNQLPHISLAPIG